MAMPMNGSKIDDMASWCVNSRHWVRETTMALVMTLIALNPMAITAQGVAAFDPATRHGETTGRANAVSAVTHPRTPQGAGTALTGMTEGTQKNTDAIMMVVMVLRSFMGGPNDRPGQPPPTR
jgi:hypothetical protein